MFGQEYAEDYAGDAGDIVDQSAPQVPHEIGRIEEGTIQEEQCVGTSPRLGTSLQVIGVAVQDDITVQDVNKGTHPDILIEDAEVSWDIGYKQVFFLDLFYQVYDACTITVATTNLFLIITI